MLLLQIVESLVQVGIALLVQLEVFLPPNVSKILRRPVHLDDFVVGPVLAGSCISIFTSGGFRRSWPLQVLCKRTVRVDCRLWFGIRLSHRHFSIALRLLDALAAVELFVLFAHLI